MTPDAAHIASRLNKPKRQGSGWVACCPAHEDRTPSLSINDGDKGPVFKCHAGCSQDAVLNAIEALGVTIRKKNGTNGNGHHHEAHSAHSDIEIPLLTVESLAAAKRLPSLLNDSHVHDEPGGGVSFQYLKADGTWAGAKRRKYLGGGSDRGFTWATGSKPCLYGLWRLEQDYAEDGRVILCEGETDALTLWQHGYTALGLPGASMWKDDWAEEIPSGAKVYVLLEPDQGGRTVEAAIEKSPLKDRAYFIRMTEAAKDPSALHLSTDDFVKAFDQMIAGAEPVRKLKLKGINFADMDPRLADSYLVKSLLPSEGEASIIGASGSGKTFVSTDLALHIASNKPWRGLRVRGGLVVYVGAESPRSVERRFAAAKKDGRFPLSLPLKLTGGPINMLDPDSVADLIEFCRAAEVEHGQKCVAIFVDTLARAMLGGEENSNDTMSAVTKTGCDRLRDELHATVIVVHHLGKDHERGSRGGSALPAAMDSELVISEEQDARVITVKKARDGVSGERFAFKLRTVELGVDDDGDPVTSCVVDHLGAIEFKIKRPSGKYQLQLLTELERRTEECPTLIWTDPEIREIARDLGQAKNTAREAHFGLKRLGYFIPSIGGSRLNYSPGKKE